MKEINLGHRDHKEALKSMKDHGKSCVLDSRDGIWLVLCECKSPEKDILKDIDTDGNGHITKKEVLAFVNKDK